MNINLGNYLEEMIRKSKYNKKDLCNKLNELFTFGERPISYTTFSNNVKTGEVTLNEVIAIAALIDEINLNKIVLMIKNELNKEKSEGENVDMKKEIVEILTKNTLSGIAQYEEENIYEIAPYEVYEGLYFTEDCKVVIMERVDITNEVKVIQEVAHFTNFDEILKELNITIDDFKKLPLNEKLDIVSEEGMLQVDILDKEMKMNCFK